MTSEEIAQRLSGGGSVQISTPDDYNALVTYLNSEPKSSGMRNVSITANLDFENKDFATYLNIEVDNITIDGGNHTLKNIVKENISNQRIFFAGSLSDNSIIKNITFSNCYIQTTSYINLFYYGYLENIKIENCRFISGNEFYTAFRPQIINDFSVSATILINRGNYSGINVYKSGSRIASVNNVIYQGSDSSASAVSVNVTGNGNFIYTRDKFTGFRFVTGISTNSSNSAYCLTSYSAISSEDAAYKYSFRGVINRFSSSYYDNTLVPNPAESNVVSLGVPTEVLQSITEMTSRGWFVKAV